MLKKSNFKTVFCLFILVLPFALLDIAVRADEQEVVKTLKIAAWNIREFGHRNDRINRETEDLKNIANILSQYDLIVITEFMSKQVNLSEDKKVQGVKKGSDFYKIFNEYLPEGYTYEITEIAGRGHGGNEHYAFLFRKNLVELVRKEGFYPDPPVENSPKGIFTRDPYAATFSTGGFDFTIIVVHIQWGEPADREREHKVLGDVFDHFQRENTEDENDVILVGDFNLNPTDPTMFLNLDSNDGNPDDHLRKKVDPAIVPLFHGSEIKSHIRDTSLYDNIFFQIMHLKEYTGESGVDCFDKVLYPNDSREKRISKAESISDHRPVWANFRINLDDDPSKYARDEDFPSNSDASTINNDSESTDSDVQTELE